MNSPPSIYEQPPHEVPAADIEGSQQFESQATGAGSWEQPKPPSLSGVRRDSPSGTHPSPLLHEQKEEITKGIPPIDTQAVHSRRRSKEVPSTQPRSPIHPKKRARDEDGAVSPSSNTSSIQAAEPSQQPQYSHPAKRRRPHPVPVPSLSWKSSLGHSKSAPSIATLPALGTKRPLPDNYDFAKPNALSRAEAPRLPHQDPGIRRAFQRVEYAPGASGGVNPFGEQVGPVSPLFFSSTPGHRPPLPPRFSSGDVDYSLMRKADVEDAAVRTVRMARGSMGEAMAVGANVGGNTPTSSSGTPTAARLGSLAQAGRASSARGIQTLEDQEIVHSTLGLAQVGVIDFLDQDDRPTFVLDLTLRSNFQPGLLHISFANHAMKAYHGLMDTVRGRHIEKSPGLSSTPTFAEFKYWVTSFVQDNEAMDVRLPAFTYAGITWRISTIKKRFRVVNGTFLPPAPSSTASDSVRSTARTGTATTPRTGSIATGSQCSSYACRVFAANFSEHIRSG